MKKLPKYSLLIIFMIVSTVELTAQPENKPIAKATYTSTPISQYMMARNDLGGTATKASIFEFMQGITDYYSLYINLENRSSVYILDSTVQVRPRGWEDPGVKASLSDTVLFALKSPDNKTYKHEWIMNQTFFSEGQVGDMKWTLTNEERTIDGLNCSKAVAENYPLLTVWYTKDVPVSNGPSVYQGLPGLVVLAEDYFRTIQLLKIEYSDDEEAFNQRYNTKYEVFAKQKKIGKHYDKEPTLLIKKGDLANYFYGLDQAK